MITIQTPDARRRPVCTACNYPEGECSGACLATAQTTAQTDRAPTVLTRSNISRLGLQNNVARRLRQTGCRVLSCTALDQPRLAIQIMPPPVHHRLRLAPTRHRLPEGPPRCEAWMDGVRVYWIDDSSAAVATPLETSHAA